LQCFPKYFLELVYGRIILSVIPTRLHTLHILLYYTFSVDCIVVLVYTSKILMNLFAGLFGGFLIKEKGGPKRLIFRNQPLLGLTYYLYCYFVQVVCLYSYFALE
jgi:hypothetical protein